MQHEDPFYNNKGTYDSLRLPLINPYYLVFIDKQYGWQMPIKANFPDHQFYYNLGDLLDITKISVIEEVIIVYSPRSRSVDESNGQKVLHWFVFIPQKDNLEIGFEKESELLIYLKDIGVDGTPQWVDPDTAYQDYYKTGCLSWIPGCKQP